jgi:endonuclease III
MGTIADHAVAVHDRLEELYEAPRTLLEHSGPYQLLIAVILSAQTTDAQVNRVTPALFAAFPLPADLAGAPPAAVEEIIHPLGFYRNKTKSIISAAKAIHERFADEVPVEMEELLTIPGVGRKSANVVRGAIHGLPAVIVDTHFKRVASRLGLTHEKDPLKIERALAVEIPAELQTPLSMELNFHGRDTCTARKPACTRCVLNDICPSALPPD